MYKWSFTVNRPPSRIFYIQKHSTQQINIKTRPLSRGLWRTCAVVDDVEVSVCALGFLVLTTELNDTVVMLFMFLSYRQFTYFLQVCVRNNIWWSIQPFSNILISNSDWWFSYILVNNKLEIPPVADSNIYNKYWFGFKGKGVSLICRFNPF